MNIVVLGKGYPEKLKRSKRVVGIFNLVLFDDFACVKGVGEPRNRLHGHDTERFNFKHEKIDGERCRCTWTELRLV